MNNIIHNNKIRQISFIVMLVLMGGLLFRELQSFITENDRNSFS